MKKYTVTEPEQLRSLCIRKNWFTCGSNEQYEKLFYANKMGCSIEEIATIIWLCSDSYKHCRRDILEELKSENPPHLQKISETAWLCKKYGRLGDGWEQMLHDGFGECMRVLKPDGVLIFKWSEYDIPAERVWKAIGQKPLFGHHSGKQSKTFWGCYMKGLT